MLARSRPFQYVLPVILLGLSPGAVAQTSPSLQALEARTQRLEDIHAVQNLVGTIAYLNETGRYLEIYDRHFARKTPGVSAQIGARGVFTDANVRKTMVDIFLTMQRVQADLLRKANPDKPIASELTGLSTLQDIGTPVIEVAGDGRTAKGMWSALIAQTSFDDETNKPAAFWVWSKYAIDFVKEDGAWKIWHYNLLPIFRTPYEKSWVTSSLEAHAGPPELSETQAALRAAMPKADRPPNAFFRPYDIMTAPADVPKAPEPYRTFSETFSY